MTREIKFRGRRLDNNEFVTGYYLPMASGAKHFIYLPLEYLNEHKRIEIDPKTLGQSTGQFDKNGVELFSGDIKKAEDGTLYVVEYNKFSASFIGRLVKKAIIKNIQLRSGYGEKIGDIHQNPELLK
jgi:uncharacterized phage protein (TIGR01671 family)